MIMTSESKELLFARETCEIAGQLAVDIRNQGLIVDHKDDGSIVTQADKECEKYIRAQIAKHFPDDEIVGEEFSDYKNLVPTEKRTWIVDPIDGTRSFASGSAYFSCFIALVVKEDPLVAAMSNPVLNNLYWAETGSGCFKNGKKVSVSETIKLAGAKMYTGGDHNVGRIAVSYPGLTELARVTTNPGCYPEVNHEGALSGEGCQDCDSASVVISFTNVLEGILDIAWWPIAYPWDNAVPKCLIKEAGGAFSDLKGGNSIYAGGCFVSNKNLHDEALSLIIGRD